MIRIVNSGINKFHGSSQPIDVDQKPQILVCVDVCMKDAAILIVDPIVDEPVGVVGEVDD